MSPSNLFRDSLLEAEPISPERQMRFRQELAQVLNPRLTPAARGYYWVACAGSAIGAAGITFHAFGSAGRQPVEPALAALCVGAAVWFAYILRRGAEPLMKMELMGKALAGLGLLVAALLIEQGLANPTFTSIFWALAGLLGAVACLGIALWNRLVVLDRATREAGLRIEYRLADLMPPTRH